MTLSVMISISSVHLDLGPPSIGGDSAKGIHWALSSKVAKVLIVNRGIMHIIFNNLIQLGN
jgi:hypothetical protein